MAAEHRKEDVVAFGLGGDELSLPFSEFRRAYRLLANMVCILSLTLAKPAAPTNPGRR